MLGILIVITAVHILIHEKKSRLVFLKTLGLVFIPIFLISIISIMASAAFEVNNGLKQLDNIVWVALGISTVFTTVYFVFQQTR
ncbi:hypothetical protein MARINOS108_11590 [Marinoscillum sp. 108]|nr:hypothetical protein MARINOS108_11590 [Marinoscillum sp. 108]